MRKPGSAALAALLFVFFVGRVAAAPEPDVSRVLRLTIKGFVEEKHDLELVLMHRNGYFHAGHALVPTRDNLVHRVDPDPAHPFEYAYKDGSKPKLTAEVMGTYAYHNPKWRKLYDEYTQGKLQIRFIEEVPPLTWDDAEAKLHGTLEVWIMPPGEANGWGLSPPANILPRRIALDARLKDGVLSGTGEVWGYWPGDMALGMRAKRQPGTVSGRWDDDFWKAAPGTEFAAGRDWPQVRGPHLSGSAIDCEKPLVSNLHDARLQWVAEEPIGAGKGAAPKVGFGFYPANFSGWGYAHYSAPIVADGKVYLYVLHPDREQARSDPNLWKNVVVRRGADPEHAAKKRHAVFCFDARTGRTLWRWMSSSFEYKGQSGKSGTGVTPCVIGNRLFVRVGGITCFDAKTGAVIWQKKDNAYKAGGGWSHEESLISIDGVLIVISGMTDLVGVDPETGEKLWQHNKVTGPNQLAARVVLDGKEYAVVSSGQPVGGDAKPVLSLIEPLSGKILWQEKSFGANELSVLVQGNIVCGNVSPPVKKKNPPRLAGAFELSRAGAKKRWEAPGTLYPPHRATPVAKDGYFYIDSRSRFYALEAKTGKLVNGHPHIYAMTSGDHNWTWHVATDNRIVTSGCLLFSTADEGFKRLPGRLSLDLVSGYMCPVKPAIADGRLFVRTMNRLLCYDLRRPADLKVDAIVLSSANPMLGYPAEAFGAELKLRVVNGAPAASYVSVPLRNSSGNARMAAPSAGAADALEMTGEKLAGALKVRVDHHNESWVLAASRKGDRIKGSCRRVIAPLRKPQAIEGKIDGKIEKKADGATWWIFSCLKAASQQPQNPAFTRQSAHLVVASYADGTRHAWVRAGRVNKATHEMDASGLEIGKDAAKGKVTVIYHSDAYVAANPEADGALAATYTIDATIADGRITGSYKGTLGVPFSATVSVTGQYAADTDLHEAGLK